MPCLACLRRSPVSICAACRRTLRPAPDRLVAGTVVRSAFLHEGAARVLVHRLKYEGVRGVASLVAPALAPLVPEGVAVVVPIRRTLVRRLRYGIDQVVILAEALARERKLCVVDAISPVISDRAILLDDVITTGETIRRSLAESGCRMAVTMTSAVFGPVDGR